VIKADAHGGAIVRAARSLQIEPFQKRGYDMLLTIIVILLILWILGVITSYTFGGLLHIILVVAVILLVIQLLSGRRRL
jgi:Family of unknown function (DUF5670)